MCGSETVMLWPSISHPSAGMTSPSLIYSMSPTTISLLGSRSCLFSRTTVTMFYSKKCGIFYARLSNQSRSKLAKIQFPTARITMIMALAPSPLPTPIVSKMKQITEMKTDRKIQGWVIVSFNGKSGDCFLCAS
jgi:hypothetical protein